jgi:hypothetical protein
MISTGRSQNLTDSTLGRPSGVRPAHSGLGENAGDINRHIADSDHCDRLGVKHEHRRVDVRMPAVPADEIGGRKASGQVFTAHAEPSI